VTNSQRDKQRVLLEFPSVGAYNWAATVGEDDVAGVQGSDSEKEK
jgi:hypothetical protein